MNYASLGQRIRNERKKLAMTQEKIAEMIGVSDAYIGQIERGERSLTLDTLIDLANKLGVTVDYLLQDSLTPNDDNYFDHIRQLLTNRSAKEKQMALNVIKVMFAHVDDMKAEDDQ
ncbi:helix-turn-helix domain-containing protein [Cohnella herbarum]|uniref:Helix-turn-helix transcriptional regulator n=1 Tax=Cohnella herbarum TaxID=2728023 RepID=A0A7Z2ZP04_9BACL|nr:helix-turn-helix transcriptional regulator [Cohnella herbarum]QJD86360.1 helix-turn-helix transcriptional regulator [Cohnella herbarum]